MGIFEKSIPKYVVNPINNNIEVEPQEVYVDDIFDPILNPTVRRAMDAKYGGGLYGITGGYSELLQNVWNGNEGLFGKGMGLLSAFGRSMEKADDIVLGALTEGVEGLSGQGFDDPLKVIFEDDEDYSGKRFLASTANIFRNIAGTSITEDDLGTAWNLPALGIDLATDVGILGGTAARKLAPAAKDFTSKQLFENLGKSDLKTTVGEIGQLMSNYDDLMARVAIDVTAPGLRPAFKNLKNRMAALWKIHGKEAYAEVIKRLKIIEDPTADPTVRKQAQDDLRKNEEVLQAIRLFNESDQKLADIPEDTFEFEMYDMGAEEPTIDRLAKALQRDLDSEAKVMQGYSKYKDKLRTEIKDSRISYNQALFEAFGKSQAKADEFGWKTDIAKYLELTNPDTVQTTVQDAVLKVSEQLDNLNPEYADPIREMVEEALSGDTSKFTHAMQTGEWSPNDATNKALDKIVEQYVPYVRKPYTPYRVSPSLRSAVAHSGAKGVSYAYNALLDLNRKNLKADEFIFKNPQELHNYLGRADVQKALEDFIPIRPLSKKQSLGLTPEEISKKELAFALGNRRKFARLLEDVYFPSQNVSTFDYTKSLIDLETFIARNANPAEASLETKFFKSLTPEEAADYAENPQKILPLSKFLEEKGLITFDDATSAFDSYRLGLDTLDGVDPAVEYLLTGKLPASVKYNDRYRKASLARASRLRKEYAKRLEDVSNSIKTYSSSSRESNDFFTKLYDTIDDISQNYLQPLRDETPHHLITTSADLSLDRTLSKDGDVTFADLISDDAPSSQPTGKSFYDSNKWNSDQSLAVSRTISDYIRYTVPADADVTQFEEFIKPMADFLDINYKTGVDVPASPKTVELVNTFYNVVVPLIETVTKDPKYANMYLGSVFSKKDSKNVFEKAPEDVVRAIKSLRRFVGAPLADVKHPDSFVFNKMYNAVVPKIYTKDFKFEPKHSSQEVDKLTEFFKMPKTPEELKSEMYPRFDKAVRDASVSEQRADNLITLADRFYDNLDNLVKDLHTDETTLTKILENARINGTSKLSKEHLKIYRAYVQEVSKLLKETPYRIYARRASDWSSTSSWNGLQSVVSHKYPGYADRRTGLHKQSVEALHLSKLIDRELAQGLDASRKVPFYYTNTDLKFMERSVIPHVPNNVSNYWNPSHKRGLLNFDLPVEDEAYTFQLGMDVDLRPERYQIYSFLKNFKGDLNSVKDFRYVDYGKLYTESGRNALTDLAARTQLRMNLIEDTPAKLTDSLKRAFDRATNSKATAKAVDSVKESLTQAPSKTVSKMAYETPSFATASADEILQELTGKMSKFIDDGGTPEAAKRIFGEKQWSLYEQIQKSRAVPRTNAKRESRATLRTKIAEELGKAFTTVSGKARPEDFKRFYKLRSKQIGDTVKGADFWTTFRRSGMLAVPYEKGSEMITSTTNTLTKNANIINEAVGKPIVEVVTYTLDNGNVAVVMRWNGNKKTAKLVKDAQKKLDNLKLDDVVFTKASALTTEEQAFLNSPVMRELSDLMDRLQMQTADQARYLGFNFDTSSPYTRHAMRHDPETAVWINNNFYSGTNKMSSDDYDALSRILSDLDGYRQLDRGTFGTILQERRFRGDYWLLDNKHHPLFEYSPDKVFNSALSDGIFANLQYQSFVDLFVNDNFKIKEWFKTPEELKEVLYAKLPNGKLSGNLQNLELVSFKTDANGKVTGLTVFDKLSDDGLRKALADENTILVPANAVSHMDNILRKDIRMSNKFWTFINKHFTIPFKFGLLSNPGFILGNVSDATLKLATTMSEKYGTTMAEEAANVADSINAVMRLKNTYNDAFKDWLQSVDEYGIKLSAEARIPDIVAMHPKYKDMFLQYLNGDLKVKRKDPVIGKLEEVPVIHGLLKEQIDEARVYMMLQDMQMNSNKLREYADLAGLEHTSDFEVPYSAWDRVTQGSGKYDWKKPWTWGLFMNNPVMKSFTDVSGSWEELIRTASIVDDLKHKRYTIEQMSEYSKYVDPGLGEARRQFDVHLEEAKNTMFNAQFDYERIGDFLEGVGKAVPFPIFFLKNFAYWMELFMKNPQWVDNAIDVQEGLWSGYNEDDDKFMTEAKGRGAIPVGGSALPDWFKGVYKPSPLQSMFGAFNLLNSPIDNLTYRVNPLISGATTAAASALPANDLTTLLHDPESVKYRPYSTNMYERNIKLNDPKFNPLEYTLHRMNPFDRSINSYLRIPDKVKKDEFQLSDVLPSTFQPMF